jgi:hypothetical protein
LIVLLDVDGTIVDTVSEFLTTESEQYWKNYSLYDDMVPTNEAIKAIALMQSKGLELHFCSTIYPEHATSKAEFLNRFFPNIPIIFTKDKHLIKGDILIDDRDCVLKLFHDAGGLILKTDCYTIYDDIKNYFKW